MYAVLGIQRVLVLGWEAGAGVLARALVRLAVSRRPRRGAVVMLSSLPPRLAAWISERAAVSRSVRYWDTICSISAPST
jgi:hypothetical protein